MAEVTNELIYEILKKIQDDTASVRSDVKEIRGELQSIRIHLHAVENDTNNLYALYGKLDQRLDRTERRIDLVEIPR